jgi:vitamin K-dependent gamma-carboxylase
MQRFLRNVDIAWLVAFRILFGAALSVSMLRFLTYGWVERLFVTPSFRFKYWGFAWVEPLSGSGMRALFVVLALLALAVAAGFAFRLTAPAFALGLTYVQLIDVSTYLNHYYLAALLAWLLSVSPAHRALSVDSWLRKSTGRSHVPVAWLYLFRVQVGVVYVFAGLAKAQSDWLIHAQPLRIWLGKSTHLPLLGPLFTSDLAPLVMSWCGFLFDSTVVGFLLYRRTRPYAYAVVIAFHALTRLLFPIGMFPLIMTLSALMFFDADWPRAWITRARALLGRAPLAPREPPRLEPRTATPFQRAALALGIAYCVVQVAMPLRFLAYGGNVLWHEQGMRFSWRVMVRAKGGNTTFVVHSPRTGQIWRVSPRTYLTGLQESEMSSQPDLILQLARHIKDDFEQRGLGPVEVRADSRVALNGRRGRPFLDPNVDLGQIEDGLAKARWVLPSPSESPAHTRPVL